MQVLDEKDRQKDESHTHVHVHTSHTSDALANPALSHFTPKREDFDYDPVTGNHYGVFIGFVLGV